MQNRGVTAVLALAMLVVTACSNAIPAATPTAAPATPTAAPTTAPPTPTATATPTAAPTAAPSATPTVAPTTAAPTATPSPTPSSAATISAECQAASLATLTAGKLTIGADNPAFPPYYQPDPPDPAWELGNPNNGKGLEGATAAAVAKALGFAHDSVTWVAVPFNNAIQPGKKAFDLYLTQVSYSADRAKAVDLSDGYFEVNQAVVALQANAISKVTDVAGLKPFKLGTQVGTTSYTYITEQIKPDKEPMAYDTMDAAISALKAKQIDGVVADLPTTFFMRDAQLDGGVIVGSLPPVGTPEHFSILLTKGSPLTACVNQALAVIKADGTLQAIVDEWITGQGAPELK